MLNRLEGDIVIKLMGLSHVANTVAGNEMLRGLSGGERKRLTTAEIVAGQQVGRPPHCQLTSRFPALPSASTSLPAPHPAGSLSS